jgi:hypothetical protein
MILDDFQLRREDWVSWLRCRAAMSKANGGSVIFLHTWRRTARELPRL